MSRSLWCCLVWAFVLIASPIAAQFARADEFDVVPLNDPLYKHLALVQKSGWTGAQKTQPDSSYALTRYEIALETAKAIFTVNARNRTDSSWAATVSRPALRSLRELTLAMRGELKNLDVDATTVVQLIDSLLKPAPLGTTPIRTPVEQRPTLGKSPLERPALGGSALVTPRERTSSNVSTPLPSQTTLELPLSQRLRIQTVLSSLAREAQDPLLGPRLSLAQTGAALDVTSWLTVRAGQERQFSRRGQFSLRAPLMNEADLLHTPEATVTSGGVDIAVRPGFTFSGSLARVSPDASNSLAATRLQGGVGLSGWQNRLVLTANVSRLMPEDSVALSTTAAKLNLDVGVTERLSLKLLYQQLFSAEPQRQADRVVAGGITVNF